MSPGLKVSRLVLGGMYRGASAAPPREVVAAAIDHGLTTLDTAPLYGLGEGERQLGAAIAGRRSQVTVLTKVGLRWDDDRGPVLFEVGVDGRRIVVRRNARPDSIRHEVEGSLRRLGTEVLDLVQIHQPDPETPVEESLGALMDLVRAGKVRHVGVSNVTAKELGRARAAAPVATVQNRLSLLAPDGGGAIDTARELQVGFLAYSPLAEGLLTPRMGPERALEPDDPRRLDPAFSKESRSRIQRALFDVVAPVAAEQGVSVTSVALAWVLARGATAAICGARSVQHVVRNVAALQVELSDKQAHRIAERFVGLRLDHPASGLRRRVRSLAQRLLRSG